MILFSKIY